MAKSNKTEVEQQLGYISESLWTLANESAIASGTNNIDNSGIEEQLSFVNDNLQHLKEINITLKQFVRMYAMVNSDSIEHMETLLGIKGEVA